MQDFTSRTDRGRDLSGVDGSRDAGFTDGGEGSPIPVNRHRSVTRSMRVDRSRSMRAVTGEVTELLDDLDERPRAGAALLASELIAQVAGPVADWNGQPVGLTAQLRADAVRLEATGPVAPAIGASANGNALADDPTADWGLFLIDRLADRWGLDGGSQRSIWVEIETAG